MFKTIGIMTAWNQDSGVAMHSKPIVYSWLKMGYEVVIFSFIKEDFHGRVIWDEYDEPFVIRCFGTSGGTNFLDPRPFLLEKYDIFVVQDLKMLPMDNLAKIFHHIKKKAKATIHVIHENTVEGSFEPPQPPSFYAFDWDAVVYFDKRQESFVKAIYGDKAHYIPFPAYPLRKVDKDKAREELNLPKDKKIVLVYAIGGYTPYLPDLPDPELDDIHFLILTRKPIRVKYKNVEVRSPPPLRDEDLDKYVGAADAVILHKVRTPLVPLALKSSAAYQLMGLGVPLLVPSISEFFIEFNNEVLKYTDRHHLKELILDAVNLGEKTKKTLEAAKKFVEEHSPEKIGKMFIDLFHKLIG